MCKNRLRTVLGILAAASTVALAGCMDASLSQSGTAPASISIQDAPSAIAAFDVEIRGDTNAARTVTGDTEALVFELAVGEEHTIDLDSTNFLGSKSFIVPRGGLQLVVPVQEKIFIPDRANNRLVMIDDMSGTDWSTTSGMEDHRDTEVGPDGRIYVAGESVGGDRNLVKAFDSIDDPAPAEIVPDITAGTVNAIGVDWEQRYVYYGGRILGGDSDFAFLRQVTLSGGSERTFDSLVSSGVSHLDSGGLWGISVGDSGDIYVAGGQYDPTAGPFGLTAALAVRIDPETASVVWVSDTLPIESSTSSNAGVLFKDGSVYVTNRAGIDGYRIVQLDARTGKITGHFGSAPADASNPRPGEFYAPSRFVAVNRAKIYVIDDGLGDGNRLISFEPDTDRAGGKRLVRRVAEKMSSTSSRADDSSGAVRPLAA